MKHLTVEPGQRFGRWVVIRETRTYPTLSLPKGRRAALCKCDCGTERVVAVINLYGASNSCGCLHSEIVARWNRILKPLQIRKHGLSSSYLFSTWRGMMRRCYDTRIRSYKYYGARDIRVCDEWLDFVEFAAYVLENLGERPTNYTLDRIDNDGNYEPGNVRWADWKTQRANQREKS